MKEVLALMINSNAKHQSMVIEKAHEFIQKFKTEKENYPTEKHYSISIVENKDTIINKIKTLIDGAEKTIFICQTLQWWMQVNFELADNIKKALNRDVKYRAVIEKPASEIVFPKELKKNLTHSNYELRMANNKLKLNGSIYDQKNACLSFYVAKSPSETPVILTNHPSLLVGSIDHFENVWRDSGKIDLRELFRETRLAIH